MTQNTEDQTPTHHLIVEAADWSKIIEARKNGISWDNLRTRNGLSALGMAIFDGSALATQTLLELGAPNLSEFLLDKTFFSPLWSAIEKKKAAILDILLQSGSDPNEIHPEYGLPILYTAKENMSEETVILCKHGASPNTKEPPSPLWLWIKNLTPVWCEEEKIWQFPDSTPIVSLLKNGARIHTDDDKTKSHLNSVNEIEFAKRQWLEYPLSKSDEHRVAMTLSLMEKNLYAGTFSKHIREMDGDSNYKKLTKSTHHKI